MKEWLSAAWKEIRSSGRHIRRMHWQAASHYPVPEREQLEQYAEAFFALAELFQKMPCQKERFGDAELEQLLLQIQEMACAGCDQAMKCWQTRYYESWEILFQLLHELETEGTITENGIAQLEKACMFPSETARAVTQAYMKQRSLLLWNNRMMEQRMAAGEEIYQTAVLWRTMAQGMAGSPRKEEKLCKKLWPELTGLGIELGSVRITGRREDGTEVFLVLRAKKKIPVSAKTVAELLSECMEVKMRPAWNCTAFPGETFETFHFVPETRFQMLCGVARLTKDGELVSGDNYAFLQKDTGRIVMSLADGMGSGIGACQESEKVIELLEQFFQAGFPQETAVRMINSCMLLQNGNQMFSTIDLCMVDLYSAGCDLIKFGAATTFLMQGEKLEAIHSRGRPAGILQQSDYESLHRQLGEGDTIVMMTDGVIDALTGENSEEQMKELICRTASPNAKEHARCLMERVYLMQKLQAHDDMTILIGKIWLKS